MGFVWEKNTGQSRNYACIGHLFLYLYGSPTKQTLAPKSYRATPMSFSGCIVLFPPEKVQKSCFLCFATSTNKDLLGFRTPLQRLQASRIANTTRLPVSHGIAAAADAIMALPTMNNIKAWCMMCQTVNMTMKIWCITVWCMMQPPVAMSRNDECHFHLSSEDIRCEHYQHFVGDPFKTPKTFQNGLFCKIALPGLTHPNINCGWLQFGELKRRFIKPIGKWWDDYTCINWCRFNVLNKKAAGIFRWLQDGLKVKHLLLMNRRGGRNQELLTGRTQ